MTDTTADPSTPPPHLPSVSPSAQRSTRRRVRVGIVVAVVVVLVVLAVTSFIEFGRTVPDFPSLATSPDPTLRGTVAYVDPNSDCVSIVAAAGSPSREVFCPPPFDVTDAMALGKPLGPQLVWLSDGRLEVTVFRMTDVPGPDLDPGWQKIVDVRTGTVTDVPADSVPSAPNLGTRPTVSPSGDRLGFTSDPQSGTIAITLTDASGRSRTLLDERGPGSYTYGLDSAFWSPDYQWVLADDGRILAITTDEPPVTRVLVGALGGSPFGPDDPGRSRFAITAESLLDPSSG